jgi:hypothetical protein
VMEDASAFAHARGGDDDARLLESLSARDSSASPT